MQAGEDDRSLHQIVEEPSSATNLNGEDVEEEDEAVQHRTSLSTASAAARITSRSPHPYHRRKVLDGTTRIKPDLASRSREEAFADRRAKEQGLARRNSKNTATRTSPNESGTEADDEGITYTKALPAPPLRPRKGLKMALATGIDGQVTPLLTPTAIDEDAERLDFPTTKRRKSGQEHVTTDEELREARAKFVKRRRAELTRRVSEVLLLVVIGILILGNRAVSSSTGNWHRVELLSHISIISALYLLYPIRLIAYAWKRTKSWKLVQRTIRLPAAFDPALLLYPQFIPVFIALILLPTFPKALLPNLVLGLASVPGGLFRFGDWDIEPLRWLVASVPLIVSDHTDFPHKVFAVKPYILKTEPAERIEPELITLLYPLHQGLVRFLQYLTTTSLLPAEVHLMSIGLINLLLCAEMPPTVIMQLLLWFGGLTVYVLIGPVIRWNITLARVPRWRFRRAGRLVQMRQSFLSILNQALTRSRSVGQQRTMGDSDADEDHEEEQSQRRPSAISLGTIRSGLLDSIKTNLFSTNTSATAVEKETWSAIEATSNDNSALAMSNGITKPSTIRLRRNTLPNLDTGSSSHQHIQQYDRKRRGYGKTFLGRSFLSLTQYEAAARKWGYAVYTYAVLVLLILGPVRNLICRYALDSHEPFGWAVGYLFGNVQRVRFLIWEWSLEWWVPLPPLLHATDCASAGITGRAECLRHVVFREANTRLLLCAWCVAIIVVGLGVVLSFTFVEVDTRRKVFHFMMVAMLLPTIFIDPAFISLALVLILAIFLILDLLRASQLPPLSRPIARFLTPYVDGRDLRGPVVVSHIFLLIGCAVPLWLSLAGMRFTGDAPWRQWEVQQRDVSMTAGVVCVGMGDAAASLIGRRFGRRKWPWTGGKSLEGSAAFAFAVTVGLVAAKAWLRIGQWLDQSGGAHDSWGIVMCKAGIAACGASFMEAVLTGGNDNVVVPVVLWLLVKALEV